MKIKICGITKKEEVFRLDELGVHYGGIWYGIPNGKYNLNEKKAKELLSIETKTLKPILVTLDHDFAKLQSLLSGTNAYGIQLHGFQLPGFVTKLKYATNIAIMKVLHIKKEECLERDLLERYVEAGTDFFVLDNYISRRTIGSTGTALDGGSVKRLTSRLGSAQVFIGGGVNEKNMLLIQRDLNPYAVDIDTTARRDDQLDYEKISKMTASIKPPHLSSALSNKLNMRGNVHV